MGDADISQRDLELPIEEVTGVLDALDEDLIQLHATVHELEQRTLRALSLQIKGYSDFRQFFLAMNFVILPCAVALALCYSIKDMLISAGAQALLDTVIIAMLYISGSLGVPLYLGALWAIYSFSLPEDALNDMLTDSEAESIFGPIYGNSSVESLASEVPDYIADEDVDEESFEARSAEFQSENKNGGADNAILQNSPKCDLNPSMLEVGSSQVDPETEELGS